MACHRVLPAAGGVGNYRWGNSLKYWMLAQEASQTKGLHVRTCRDGERGGRFSVRLTPIWTQDALFGCNGPNKRVSVARKCEIAGIARRPGCVVLVLIPHGRGISVKKDGMELGAEIRKGATSLYEDQLKLGFESLSFNDFLEAEVS